MSVILSVLVLAFLFYHIVQHLTPMFLKKLAVSHPAPASGVAGASVHFAYGSFVGGVSGHLTAAYASLPVLIIVYILARYFWPDEVQKHVGLIDRVFINPLINKFNEVKSKFSSKINNEAMAEG